jgi:hypothetical protein
MTQITLTLPEAIVAQIERQVKQRNMSLDEFALKLFSDTLMAEPVDASPSPENHIDPFLALEALVVKIKATPPNPAMTIPPTQTLAQVVAYWQAHPAEESDIAPEEWDRLWAEFEREQKVIDQADAIAEGHA